MERWEQVEPVAVEGDVVRDREVDQKGISVVVLRS